MGQWGQMGRAGQIISPLAINELQIEISARFRRERRHPAPHLTLRRRASLFPNAGGRGHKVDQISRYALIEDRDGLPFGDSLVLPRAGGTGRGGPQVAWSRGSSS